MNAEEHVSAARNRFDGTIIELKGPCVANFIIVYHISREMQKVQVLY
jgi:hypothetical protein